eukprot:CAMPEP_0202458046 /NCGR_PEP_ID=MMETSP1360-20130828/20837_1 /ASSEMBLY_ACC=CAM_ASM_000848 /TAXON_ID=515479 /ORGANISM="Licmophora paradoxa, Strain CCMP2313" /LENGTH=112 /DNA_ID=CAMNT_0049078373 /DNA_START=204 /DNA_END=542 /DNA_ORIENTATION=+
MAQAKITPGIISADSRTINGVQHTLTAWKSRKDMLAFYRSESHVEAMKAFSRIASRGKVFSYESENIPSWEEAREIWEKNGREYKGGRGGGGGGGGVKKGESATEANSVVAH